MVMVRKQVINKEDFKDYLDSISDNPYGHPEFPGVVINWSEESGAFRATNGFWISINIDFDDSAYISFDKLGDSYKEQKEYIDNILRKKINRLFSLMGRTMALYKNKNVTKKNICSECGLSQTHE